MTNERKIRGSIGVTIGVLALFIIVPAAQAQDSTGARQDTSLSRKGDTAQAEVQNPPGYRGMERPVNVLPSDSGARADSSAPADATSRINQRRRQRSMGHAGQNPPGYRGMERPVGGDSATAQRGDSSGQQARSARKAGSKRKHATARDSTQWGQDSSSRPGAGDSTAAPDQQ
jgi:hypothetical protein